MFFRLFACQNCFRGDETIRRSIQKAFKTIFELVAMKSRKNGSNRFDVLAE